MIPSESHLLYMLNEDGESVLCDDVSAWGQWFETADRHVAEACFGDVRVSTVFLGIDHGFGRPGPPVLWESLVFGGPLNGEMQRYTSRAEANAGHTDLCHAVVRAQEQTVS